MRTCYLCGWGCLSCLLLVAMAGADEHREVRRTEDVIYGRKDGLALTLDVFQPDRPNGCGIIYLVNGGWQSSKSTPRMQNITPEYYERFLDHGYTVFAVVTSSQPKYFVPDLMQDCQRVVRYIRTHAATYGVDKERLGVTGSSSGGHLTLTIAAMARPGNPTAEDPVERESSSVRAVACFFPPTDFLNYGGPGINGVGQGPLAPLRIAFGPHAETEAGRTALGKEFSPIYGITAALPPTLIIHGDADETVPLQQSQRFVERAKSVGVKDIELIVRPGKGHGWPQGSIVWKSEEDVREFIRWFDTHLLDRAGRTQ